MKCPKCSADVNDYHGAFVEIGEWLEAEQTYEEEYNVDGYKCQNPDCECIFFI